MIDFSSYDAVLLDLDGTIYHDDDVLAGAPELIVRLQRDGGKFACLSNSTNSPQRLSRRLATMRIDLPPERIYTAAAATCDYALEHFAANGRQARIYNLATEGVQDLLDGKVHWVQTHAEPCDAIIVGAPVNLYGGEDRQLTAIHLLRQGAALLGICADRLFPSPRGIEIGTGAFSHMLAYAANVTPTFCGKPEPIFFHELCERIGVEASRCILIGDNLESDILGGKRLGMRTVLTLTGVTRRSDLDRAREELRPDDVINDLSALL